ncbi:hypothetical protein BDV93DRAFT_514981 [Ceratobasidium sp. AG-I]|nr:hypothetical protein BDV93DRAFT_514981 [Ceratobasidium sp. AG-I]
MTVRYRGYKADVSLVIKVNVLQNWSGEETGIQPNMPMPPQVRPIARNAASAKSEQLTAPSNSLQAISQSQIPERSQTQHSLPPSQLLEPGPVPGPPESGWRRLTSEMIPRRPATKPERERQASHG